MLLVGLLVGDICAARQIVLLVKVLDLKLTRFSMQYFPNRTYF